MTARSGPPRLGIVGPTATGKSAIALEVALRLGDVEIVTVDSMQVYRGMNIGTAKPTASERAKVRHHLLDIVDPADDFTLRQFQEAANESIADIESRGKRPLLVGGTGLYVRAITDELEIPGRYPAVRLALEAQSDIAALYEELQHTDPLAASRMEPTNRRRIVRALEVCRGSGRPFTSFGAGLDRYPDSTFDVVALGMDRDRLAERIEQRYQRQLEVGFVDEVRALAAQPIGRTAAQALGYRQLFAHLRGECTLGQAIDTAVAATRRFARRQRSWFRRDPRLKWIDMTDREHTASVAAELVDRWRNPPAEDEVPHERLDG